MSLLPQVLAVAARGFAALLLARAAWAKLEDRETFAGALAGYRLLPERLVAPAALALPLAEAALAAILPWPKAFAPALFASAVLFAVFALAVGVNLARGRTEIACGCGGPSGARPIGWGLAARNLAYAAALIAASTIRGAPDLAIWLLGLAAGGVLFLLNDANEALSALPARRRLDPTLRNLAWRRA